MSNLRVRLYAGTSMLCGACNTGSRLMNAPALGVSVEGQPRGAWARCALHSRDPLRAVIGFLEEAARWYTHTLSPGQPITGLALLAMAAETEATGVFDGVALRRSFAEVVRSVETHYQGGPFKQRRP